LKFILFIFISAIFYGTPNFLCCATIRNRLVHSREIIVPIIFAMKRKFFVFAMKKKVQERFCWNI